MWLSDFQLVLSDRLIPRGSLRIEDGIIADIVETPVANATIVGRGHMLLPGFVDIHGDMVEREIEPRPNVRMPLEMSIFELDKKLAACGITTAFAALSLNPLSSAGYVRSIEHTRQTIEAIGRLRDALLVDHKIHARLEVTFPEWASAVEALMRGGHLDMISLTDHTPGQGQYRDTVKYAAFLAKARKISEQEAMAVVQERMMRASDNPYASAPVVALTGLAKQRGTPIASHDDDTVAKVTLVRNLGVQISEFPVTLEAAREARRLGLATAMGSPNALRGMSYSGNLSARELHGQGMLDILASDYHPPAMLQSVFAMAEVGNSGLAGAVALVTRNPAKACGLSDRGALEIGMRADLVVAEVGTHVRLRATFRTGRLIYSDGAILNDGNLAEFGSPFVNERHVIGPAPGSGTIANNL